MGWRSIVSRVLSSEHVAWWAGLVLLVLLLPSLGYGLILDDHLHRVILGGAHGLEWAYHPPWDLFAFVPDDPAFHARAMEEGALTWMASPTVHATLMRPLASLSLALDHAIAPRSPWVAHVQSLVWALALVLVGGRLFKSLFRGTPGPTWMVGLATWMYALDEGHAYVASWIANRNALQAMVFALLALDSHVRWRRDGSPGHGVAAPVLLVLGLLCGEMALSVVAYLFAYAVLLDHGAWSRRLAGLAPAALTTVAWRVVYSALGYGTGGSQLYVDPVNSPARFALAVVERLPLLLVGQLTPIPAELRMMATGSAVVVLVVVASGLLAVVGAAVWGLVQRERLAGFFVLGGALAAVPSCATFPHDRLLVPVGIGVCGAVALLLARTGESAPTVLRHRLERYVAVTLTAFLAVLAPLNIPVRTYSLPMLGKMFDGAAYSLDCVPDIETKTVVFVHGPDFFMTAWTPVLRADMGRPFPKRIRVLGSSYEDVEVTRTGPQSLELRPENGYLTSFLDLVMWSPDHPFTVGQRFTLSDLEIEVLEVTADHRPAAIAARFLHPLDSDDYAWVAWTRDGYRPFVLPDQGETVHLEGVPLLDMMFDPPPSPSP